MLLSVLGGGARERAEGTRLVRGMSEHSERIGWGGVWPLRSGGGKSVAEPRASIASEREFLVHRKSKLFLHTSWARIDDDANPAAEALAAREGRRSREQDELGFSSAAERR
jgi:hypothetical protein